MIATAALFLAGKSEESPRPLNNVLRASSEVLHKQDFALLSYRLPVVSTLQTTEFFPLLQYVTCERHAINTQLMPVKL